MTDFWLPPPKNRPDTDSADSQDTFDTPKAYLKKLRDYSDRTIQALKILDENTINFDIVETLILHIASNTDGAILVFLPGMFEIVSLNERLKKSLPKGKFLVLPLHSSLPSSEQHRVFERAPNGVTKIILSTSILMPSCNGLIIKILLKRVLLLMML
jgi:HrpA-like RNA helicase